MNNNNVEFGAIQGSLLATQNHAELAKEETTYNPGNLLDALIVHLGLKNDAALARALEVAPPLISKIRHRTLPLGGSVLIRMHEVSKLSIADMRTLMGDRRHKFRISDKQFKPKEVSVQFKD